VEHLQHLLTFIFQEWRYHNMGIAVFPAPSSALIQKSQTFNSSGTFTLPAGYGAGQPLIISALVCGGGGGGGGGGFDSAGSTGGGGGGGGSGVATFFENISLTANATITIGAGGSGGTGTSSARGNMGASGGSSNINSLFNSPGGGGGGFGGTNSFSGGRGFSVNSFGYNIQGGQSTSVNGGGGAGGSGGQASNTNDTNPQGDGSFFAGGSYGDAGIFNRPGGSASNIALVKYDHLAGAGVRRGPVQTTADFPSNTILTSFVPDSNQPGGGGAGGYDNTAPRFGQAGSPGTRIGGLNGFQNGTQKDASAATTPGAGGGGGGGSANHGGRGGNGGAGGTGFVTIYWWG